MRQEHSPREERERKREKRVKVGGRGGRPYRHNGVDEHRK
jgi:hypothetical protein